MTRALLVIFQLWGMLDVSFEYPIQAKCMEQVRRNDYHPIRISVDYIGFDNDSENQDNFTLLREVAMPRVISYWSNTLSVRQTVDDWLLYKRPCRGSAGVYCVIGSSDADVSSMGYMCEGIRLNISPNDIDTLDVYDCEYTEGENFKCSLSETIPSGTGGGISSSTTDLKVHILNRQGQLSSEYIGTPVQEMARVNTCGQDECGRPTIGVMQVFSALFENDIDSIVTTLIHEFTHIAGFEINSMSDWVSIETGEFLLPLEKQFRPMYIIGKDKRNSGSAETTVEFFKRGMTLGETHDGILYQPTIPYHVIKNIDETDEKCTCPIDPNEKYTDDDISNCVSHASRCLFAITSPNVVNAMRKYYNCERAIGMPLHVVVGYPFYLNPHWKLRYLFEELMNPSKFGMPVFISIITMGLLKDTGWYLVNEEYGASATEPGIAWGHQDGCEILFKIYVDPTTEMIVSLPHTKKEFNGKNPREYKEHQTCFSSAFGYGAFVPTFNDPRKQNNKFTFSSVNRVTCTHYENNYQSRCIDCVDTQGSPQPICVDITCKPDLLMYSFVVQSSSSSTEITCHSDEQQVKVKDTTYVCRDPRVICARLTYTHLLPSSGLNSPPGIRLPAEGRIVSLQDIFVEMSENGNV